MAEAKTASVPKASDEGSKYSYGGIVCGIISFFLLGIILAIVAIILGGVGVSKGDQTKGIVAIVIGIISLILNAMALATLSQFGLI